MNDRIIAVLKKQNIDKWRIVENTSRELQRFFIKKRLDLKRYDESVSYNVTVFVEFTANEKRYLGSSSADLNADMTDEEIEKKIAGLKYAAGFVKNPYYELAKANVSDGIESVETNISNNLTAEMNKLTDALYRNDNKEDVWINSAELFVTEEVVRVMTSVGTNVAFEKRSMSGEYVAQCMKPQDVETYDSFEFDEFDADQLAGTVERILAQTKDRAKTTKLPKKGTYRVIISDKNLPTLMSFFTERADAGYVYPGYSQLKPGENIQGEKIIGEKVNISLKSNAPYSSEGIKMSGMDLFKEGVLERYTGSERLAYYLGCEPTGWYPTMELKNGTVSFEEMKKTPYLWVVNFSDFQMDAFNGHFGGEIRLAYYFDGEKVETVTGGSISASMLDTRDNLVFTTDKQNISGFVGPFAVALENVRVAGE